MGFLIKIRLAVEPRDKGLLFFEKGFLLSPAYFYYYFGLFLFIRIIRTLVFCEYFYQGEFWIVSGNHRRRGSCGGLPGVPAGNRGDKDTCFGKGTIPTV